MNPKGRSALGSDLSVFQCLCKALRSNIEDCDMSCSFGVRIERTRMEKNERCRRARTPNGARDRKTVETNFWTMVAPDK